MPDVSCAEQKQRAYAPGISQCGAFDAPETPGPSVSLLFIPSALTAHELHLFLFAVVSGSSAIYLDEEAR